MDFPPSQQTSAVRSEAPASPLSESARLVKGIAAGDQEAERQFAVRYMPPVKAMLMSRLRDADLAGDLKQDVMIEALCALRKSQIQDPESELNRQWDQEHDRYVLRCLLDLMEQEFEPSTIQAFRRLALEEASGAEVAEELGLSVAAVYVAKSRVLHKIRQHGAGLID